MLPFIITKKMFKKLILLLLLMIIMSKIYAQKSTSEIPYMESLGFNDGAAYHWQLVSKNDKPVTLMSQKPYLKRVEFTNEKSALFTAYSSQIKAQLDLTNLYDAVIPNTSIEIKYSVRQFNKGGQRFIVLINDKAKKSIILKVSRDGLIDVKSNQLYSRYFETQRKWSN